MLRSQSRRDRNPLTARRVAALVAAPVVVVALVAMAYSGAQEGRQVIIHATGPQLSFDEIADEADLIVRVRSGTQSTRWNSPDNRGWVAADDHGPAQPMIYTSTEMDIIEVLDGTYDGDTITVMTVGGSVGSDRVLVDSVSHPRAGAEYILALAREVVPARQGEFKAWMPVSLGQGQFELAAGVFRNNTGIETPTSLGRTP